MSERLYKFLKADGLPARGGQGIYTLPVKGKGGEWTPTEWMPEIKGKLRVFSNGYHLVKGSGLLSWLDRELYIAEAGGRVLDAASVTVASTVRLLSRVETWNDRSARLFGCWCVRNTPVVGGGTVWDMLDNPKSREAVDVAERFARGEASDEERQRAGRAAWFVAIASTNTTHGSAARAAAWTTVKSPGEAAWAPSSMSLSAAWGSGVKSLYDLNIRGEWSERGGTAPGPWEGWEGGRETQLARLLEVLGGVE